jgi:hypothetical protein
VRVSESDEPVAAIVRGETQKVRLGDELWQVDRVCVPHLHARAIIPAKRGPFAGPLLEAKYRRVDKNLHLASHRVVTGGRVSVSARGRVDQCECECECECA